MTETFKDILIGAMSALVLLFGGGFVALYRSSVSDQLRVISEALQAVNRTVQLLAEKFERHQEDDREAHAELATISERVRAHGDRIESLADWKHQQCEPAVRYVGFLKDTKPWERR